MNLKTLRRWVAALRSGRYAQGHHALRRDEAHCCLGVLCDVADPEGWGCVERDGGRFAHRGETCVPRPALQDALGLNAGLVDKLINLNDVQRLPFAKLADWIEANVATRPQRLLLRLSARKDDLCKRT